MTGRKYTPSHAKLVTFSLDVEVCAVPRECDGRMGTWIQDNMREERERQMLGLACAQDEEEEEEEEEDVCSTISSASSDSGVIKNSCSGQRGARGRGLAARREAAEGGDDFEEEEGEDEGAASTQDDAWLVLDFGPDFDVRAGSKRSASISPSQLMQPSLFGFADGNDSDTTEFDSEEEGGNGRWDDDDEEDGEGEGGGDDTDSVVFEQCPKDCSCECCRDEHPWFGSNWAKRSSARVRV